MGIQEFRPGRFEVLPPVIKNLLIINVLVFLAQSVFTQNSFSIEDTFALHTWQSSLFKPWQFVTHIFMHASWGHIFSNMFALWMFGSILENVWGPKRFLTFYLICGLVAAITQMGSYAFDYWQVDHMMLSAELEMQYQQNMRLACTVGASGAIMGVLAAFGYLFPNTELFIMPIPFPVKAKWAIMGIIALDVFGGISKVPGDNIAHFAHLGGAAAGFLMVLYWNKTNKQTFY